MNILITGVTGFIGGRLCQQLLDDQRYEIVALVRPQTKQERYERFAKSVHIVEAEFTDEAAIDQVFAKHRFDCVFHIAAIRGGGAASKEEFDRANIAAPVFLASAALKHGAKFVYCSSVGVFGTIPAQLPPNEDTPKIGDTYYHYTKIEAEKYLLALQEKGLQLIIIRPVITYGIGDRGFPLLLIKFVDKGLLLLPSRDIQIHFVDVRTLVDAFLRAMQTPDAVGKIYTITDKTPVSLKAFVSYIALQLRGEPYPTWKIFPTPLYRFAEFLFEHILKRDAWIARVKLMSRDWYYDGALAEKELYLQPQETIPNFEYVIEWYKNVMRDACY
jgi:nucleoside-diphosphate-sugar epimerase